MTGNGALGATERLRLWFRGGPGLVDQIDLLNEPRRGPETKKAAPAGTDWASVQTHAYQEPWCISAR